MTWIIRSSRYVVDGPHLRLRADTVELPDGAVVDSYYVRESRGYSIVCAVTPEHRLLLVRQYKHGIGEIVLELPAGGIDEGELPSTCATRELAEETGYRGDPPEFIAEFISEPTASNARFYLYVIRNARLCGPQQLDPTEHIEVETTDVAGLHELVRSGAIRAGSQVASILYLLDAVATGRIAAL